MTEPQPTFHPAPPDAPEAAPFIAALDAELAERYPDTSIHGLAPDDHAAGRLAFFVVRVDGRVVGCGGWRRLGPDLAELKRFYILPADRGRGLAGRLLRHVEEHARAAGIRTMWLETGEAQPEALALYRRHGYTTIPLYGEYINDPLSVCLGRAL